MASLLTTFKCQGCGTKFIADSALSNCPYCNCKYIIQHSKATWDTAVSVLMFMFYVVFALVMSNCFGGRFFVWLFVIAVVITVSLFCLGIIYKALRGRH